MKINYYFYLLSLLCLQSCAIYSFSGISLPKKVKTFSVQHFYVDVAKGPNNMADMFTEQLTTALLQKTRLQYVEQGGDIQFEGKIIDFSYKPISTQGDNTSHVSKLIITVEVDYCNSYDPTQEFSRKKFTQYKKAVSEQSINEEALTIQIFDEIIKNICNESITRW